MKIISLKSVLFSFFALALVFNSCKPKEEAPPGLDLAQVRAEIQAMENTYATAQNSGDIASIMPYYASDAVSMTDKGPVAAGTEAIMERLKADIATNKNTYQFDVVDIFAEGDLAVETGKTTVKDSTGMVVQTGKYISVFQKKEGKYVCVRDIYNQDAPPATK